MDGQKVLSERDGSATVAGLAEAFSELPVTVLVEGVVSVTGAIWALSHWLLVGWSF